MFVCEDSLDAQRTHSKVETNSVSGGGACIQNVGWGEGGGVMNVEPVEDISKPNPPDSCNDWGPELMEDEEKGGVKNWTDKTGGR